MDLYLLNKRKIMAETADEEGTGKATLEVNPDQEKLPSGIEQRGCGDDEDDNEEEEKKDMVWFKYKNTICKGTIIGIKPPHNDIKSHTEVELKFEFRENACSYLKNINIKRLYQDLLIRNDEHNPPPLSYLYLKYGIDIETYEPVKVLLLPSLAPPNGSNGSPLTANAQKPD